MTRIHFGILSLSLVALAGATGCSSSEANDRLLDGDPAAQGASAGSLYDHQDTGTSQATAQRRASEEQQVGSPEVYARLHSCGKITVHGLSRILTTRGVSTSGTAFSLFQNGVSAFGAANYGSRAPEVIIASTANLTKQFDILVAAAPEMLANVGAADGPCPNAKLYDQGSFTKDGLSCIMGKPAKAEHIFLANQAVKDAVAAGITEDNGKAIAVAAILQAAHTCE